MKEKIEKLIAHEKSARELGNIDEANAFRKKIQELKDKEAELLQKQNQPLRWKCSCGYELVLANDAGAGNQVLAEIMLSRHRGYGHHLTQIN